MRQNQAERNSRSATDYRVRLCRKVAYPRIEKLRPFPGRHLCPILRQAPGLDLLDKPCGNRAVPPLHQYVFYSLLAKSIAVAQFPDRPAMNEIELNNSFRTVVPMPGTPEPHHLSREGHQVLSNCPTQAGITANQKKFGLSLPVVRQAVILANVNWRHSISLPGRHGSKMRRHRKGGKLVCVYVQVLILASRGEGPQQTIWLLETQTKSNQRRTNRCETVLILCA
jgi:hypothetical protein